MKFLKEVKEETSARRKLRNLLVLLCRLAAIAFLVFAFAQPFIPQDTEVKQGEKAVSLFVDNSFSMSSLSADVPLIEKAKQRAREIVNAYEVEDRFQILTNDFEGRHQRMVSKEDALSLIEEIKISPAVKELSKVLNRQQQALNTGKIENKVAYIISDFQKNITDIQDFKDTLIEKNLIPLQSVQEKNISIDTCWFVAPVQMINQTNRLIVRLKNQSDQEEDNVRLSLRLDGQEKPVGTFSVPPNGLVTDTVNITILRTGWHEAELNITDYPVQFDDKYFFSFNVDQEINILVINEGTRNNKYLDAAFAGLSYFKINNQNSKNLDYSSFNTNELIVINDLTTISTGLSSELKQYVEAGGNLLVFPSANANVSSYKPFLELFRANELNKFDKNERTVSDINTAEYVFSDVFENTNANLKLPVTQGNFAITTFGSRGEERLLSYRDGSSYLGKYKSGQGHLYLCSAPLNEDFNNIVRSGEIFIPMLYKMAISTAQDIKVAYTIGKDDVLETENRITEIESVYKLKGRSEEFIPSQKVIGSKVLLGVNNQIKEADFYDLYLKPEETLGNFAFNYDRKESKLDYYNEDDLEELVGSQYNILGITAEASLTTLVGERSRGVTFWRWCIILALVFLGLETLFLRLWKV